MNDEYLWDRAGPPDPEVERLERGLAPYRWKGRVPRIEAPRGRRVALAASLAGAALLVAGAFVLRRRPAATPAETQAYLVESVSGSVRIEGKGAPRAGGAVHPGDRIVCGPEAEARIRVGPVGSVALAEESRLRIEGGGADDEAQWRLFLERGTLAASIFAAPRLFQVGTPSGIAVDLGCVYRATVDDDGRTLLEVVSGRVAFETAGRKVFVPAGASCRADPSRGPGTPVWEDAVEAYREAVERVDAEADVEALRRVLATDRPKDSLTLWHLLDHGAPAVRASAFDRLAELASPPSGVTREGCLTGDRSMLEVWKREMSSLW